MIKIINDNILHATEDIICHQVNCQNAMGSGVAKAIYTRYPIVKSSYHKFCNQFDSPDKLLGKVQIVRIKPDQCVANIFGQLEYGRNKNKRYTDYPALARAFSIIRNEHPGQSLAFPYNFGCGLANGNWDLVYKMIEMAFRHMDVAIYKLPEHGGNIT